ncbi:pyroglutamyl-peptidase 1-like isoform X2 [Polypterus senegalus]|uniref:pyroglutamyl-peptidase 1-like isoform X2 n=1 Tax=Polypterus senegalus TaxID=55291 RepID=UPI001964859F|nr:pyroglutamyl-peptidase 1-like isoform X2 [Polypterus senegalus]
MMLMMLVLAEYCRAAVPFTNYKFGRRCCEHPAQARNKTRNPEGFGPFRQHLVNPSWEAVKGVKASGLLADVQIHIMEVPVSYRKAQEVILGMWRSLNPKLAVHFGVAPRSDTIILEQTGKNTKYTNRDIEGLCPSKGCCVEGGPQQIDSIIDMKAARRRLQLLGLDVLYSRDAGRLVVSCEDTDSTAALILIKQVISKSDYATCSQRGCQS